jgi:hypothetical protein
VLRSVRFAFFGRERAFSHIFRSRYWGDAESVSGIGSSLAQTENIRKELPRIVDEFGIRSIVDAPCGDLYWMSEILPQLDVDYFGGDIVPEVVALAEARNTYPRARFGVFDIAASPFPKSDLWICRDVLFHLSFDDIRKALGNFLRSDVKYLLVTSHTGAGIANRKIVTGDFRQLDLLKRPFGFPEDKVLYRFADYAEPLPSRDMLLFAREDLQDLKLV